MFFEWCTIIALLVNTASILVITSRLRALERKVVE